MSRVKDNSKNREAIDKMMKECPLLTVSMLEGIYYLLADISISLAVIAEESEGTNEPIRTLH